MDWRNECCKLSRTRQAWESISSTWPDGFAKSRMILEGVNGSPSNPTRWSSFCVGNSPCRARSFQRPKNRAESSQRGGHFKFAVKSGGQPIAEGGGAKGQNASRIHGGGDAGAGLSFLRSERRSGAGVIEERGGLIGLRDAGHDLGSKIAHGVWRELFEFRKLLAEMEIFRAAACYPRREPGPRGSIARHPNPVES